MDPMKTGVFLAALRREKGMTQQGIAEKLGVSNKTVSKWESGGGYPDITVLPALAALYGVTADELLAGERRRAASSAEPDRVSPYLDRRGELRFRIGMSGALLFLLAGYYFWYARWGGLLLLGSVLSVWLGWTAPAEENSWEKRFWALLALAVGQAWIVAQRMHVSYVVLRLLAADAQDIHGFLNLRLSETLFLLLLPLVYLPLRLWLRRKTGPAARLLPRAVFWAGFGGWAVALGINGARWARELPTILEYIRVPVWKKRLLRELLAGTIDPVAKGVFCLWVAAVALAILWTVFHARKKAVAKQGEQ